MVSEFRTRWVFWMTLLVAATSALAAIYVQHYAQYPMPMWRGWVFRYLLFHQDMPGLALLVAIAGLACVPATHRPALALVEAIGRRPWASAAVAFVALCAGALFVAQNHALAGDEHLTLMQSRIFAAGRLSGEVPPELMPWLMADFYRYRWIMLDPHTGEFVSIYWPGFALLLTPFTRLGVPWACNPLLAALSLALIGRLASRLTQSREAGGWAILLAAASPAFGGFALSYFPMTAHLLLNLLFAWLLIERGRRGLVSAGLVEWICQQQHRLAGNHAVRDLCRVHRAAHTFRNAGSDALRLHSHRARQGPERMAGGNAPCAARRFAAGDFILGTSTRISDNRHRGGGKSVRAAGAGKLLYQCMLQSR